MDTTELFQLENRRQSGEHSQRVLLRNVLVALTLSTGGLTAFRFMLQGFGSLAGWALALGSITFALGLVILRTNNGPERASFMIVWGGIVTVFLMAFAEGGLHSEALYWIPFAPFLSTLLFTRGTRVLTAAGVSLFAIAALFFVGPIVPVEPAESISMHTLRALALGSAVGFGAFVATALERDRLQRQKRLWMKASHHPLTGLKSRDFFMDILQLAVERSRRGDTSLALLFVDLDKLKQTNDSYGHPAGDELIKESARRIDHSTRGGDVVCHLGGDEFTVMIEPCPDITEAQRVAERIRVAVAESIPFSDDTVLKTSASVGIAVYAAPESAPDLVRRADRAMYQAKSAGGDSIRTDPIGPPAVLRKSG